MNKDQQLPTSVWKSVVFLSLLFLVFFQLVADFIESIYTFGLLGTDIPPEIVSIVLFFSPFILVFFKRTPSARTAFILTGTAAIIRAVELVLPPSGKMLASGLGVGILLFVLPIIAANLRKQGGLTSGTISAGLWLALSFSILLRTLGTGSDITLFIPSFGWLICALLIASTLLMLRHTPSQETEQGSSPVGFGKVAALSIGFTSILLVMYFAFTSPTVISRWSGIDYRLILLFLGVALFGSFTLFSSGGLKRLTKQALLVWNILFVISGAAGILIHQTQFPLDEHAYPLYQSVTPWVGQVPLFLMILLCPILLIDFSLIASELGHQKPTMRQLGGGFGLGALVFLLIVLAQVFTTVYDYIPVVGPWFRDRFWLVFLAAALSATLPLLLQKSAIQLDRNLMLRVIFFPVLLSMMLISVVVSVTSQPEPSTTENQTNLRVLTYNIQQGYDQSGNRAYLQQLAVIRSYNPDIVGLQESDVARFSGGNADIVRTFAEGLNMYAYYGPKTVSGTFGIALLSRDPLDNPQTFFMYSVGEQTAAITADVTVGKTKHHVLVTHLGNSGPIIQQEQVLAALAGKTNVIAMGDFNFRPATDQFVLTDQTLDSGWVLAGSPAVPGLNLDKLIDHIFVSPGTPVKSAEYIVSPVSDHPGLVVDISLGN